jgi:DNA-binding MarR family transcriptional regulator
MSKLITVDYLLRSAWISISKMYNELASKHDSSMVMGFTLLSIDPKHGSTSMSLGPKMGIEPTSLSRTLVRLEKEKYIIRETSDVDRRSVIIKLTKKGLEMRDISKEYVLNFQNQVRNALTEDEMDCLMTSLSKISSLTNEINTKLNNPLDKKINIKTKKYESIH